MKWKIQKNNCENDNENEKTLNEFECCKAESPTNRSTGDGGGCSSSNGGGSGSGGGGGGSGTGGYSTNNSLIAHITSLPGFDPSKARIVKHYSSRPSPDMDSMDILPTAAESLLPWRRDKSYQSFGTFWKLP